MFITVHKSGDEYRPVIVAPDNFGDYVVHRKYHTAYTSRQEAEEAAKVWASNEVLPISL